MGAPQARSELAGPGSLSPHPAYRPTYSRAELIKDLRSSRPRELGLDATAAHVREKLMVFVNGDRETYVSVTTLAAAVGRSEKTVRRALSRLYAGGDVTAPIAVRAGVTVRRRVADGVSDQDLLDAVMGARSRSEGDGWPGVSCAFAVVMARAEYVRDYAQRGREAREASERRQRAERERRAQERAAAHEVQATRSSAALAALAEDAALAVARRYDGATRLARELTEQQAGGP